MEIVTGLYSDTCVGIEALLAHGISVLRQQVSTVCLDTGEGA